MSWADAALRVRAQRRQWCLGTCSPYRVVAVGGSASTSSMPTQLINERSQNQQNCTSPSAC
eukprot:6182266-Pleurochrysis_carterae.AAC.3